MMLVIGFGLKAKVCDLGLGLAINWPWPSDCGLPWRFGLGQKIQGQNLGSLQNLPLTSIDWSELYFKIHVPLLEALVFLKCNVAL